MQTTGEASGPYILQHAINLFSLDPLPQCPGHRNTDMSAPKRRHFEATRYRALRMATFTAALHPGRITPAAASMARRYHTIHGPF
jgi:hypothetical protein